MATKVHRGTDKHGKDVWLFRAYGAKAETFHGTETAANKALARYSVRVEDKTVAKPSSETMAPLFEEWWSDKPWKSSGARKQARESLDRYLLPHFGQLQRSRFNEDRIEAVYKGLQLTGPKSLAKRKLGLAPRTLRRHHADLHLFCVWAVKKRHLGYNPAALVDTPAIPPTTVRAPEDEDVIAILEEAAVRTTRGRRTEPCPEMATYVRLLAETGRRREDGLGIQVRDVIMREQAVMFDKRAVDGEKGQGVLIEPLDKNGRAARLAVGDVTFAGLLAQIERLQARATAAGVTLPRTAYLFSDRLLGELPWSPNATSARFRAITKRLGLNGPGGVTLHSLRHGVITSLLEEGMEIEAVAQQVGDDPVTILRIYSHFRKVNDRRGSTIMSRKLDGTDRVGLTLVRSG